MMEATGSLVDPRRDFAIYRMEVGRIVLPLEHESSGAVAISRLTPANIMFSSKKLTGGQDILALMNCRRLPARLTTGETAAILGFQEHDIAPLISARLLTPLGKPAPNSSKYFASVDVLHAAGDREWLSQATRALARYWQGRNARKKSTQHLTVLQTA